jgi:hypothetical protein
LFYSFERRLLGLSVGCGLGADFLDTGVRFLVQLSGQSTNLILESVARGDLFAGATAFLGFQLLEIAMDGCLRTRIT